MLTDDIVPGGLMDLTTRLDKIRTRRAYCLTVAAACRHYFAYDSILICFYADSIHRMMPVFGEDTFEGEVEPRECVLDELVRGPVNLHPRLTNRETRLTTAGLQAYGDESRLSMSLMYCPVYDGENLVGSISVQSYTPFRYSKADLALLEEVANESGTALVRVRSEEQRIGMERAVDQSASMILITDPDGRIKYANKRLLDRTGYSIDEVWGKNPRLFKSGNTRLDVYADIWSRIRRGETWKGLLQNRTKSGELYWAKVNISPVYDQSGELMSYLSVQEDVSAEIETADELERRASILRAVGFAAERFLRSSHWEECIPEFLMLMGEAAGVQRVYILEARADGDDVQMIHRHNWKSYPSKEETHTPPPRYSIRAHGLQSSLDLWRNGRVEQACVSAMAEEARLNLQSWNVKSFLHVPIMVDGVFWGVIGFHQCDRERHWLDPEIEALRTAASILGAAVERARMGDALALSERLSQSLLECSPLNCFLLDTSGRILALNDRASKAVGRSIPELIGSSAIDLGPESDLSTRKQRIDRVLKSHKPLYFEEEFRGRIYANYLYPIEDSDSNIIKLADFSLDITELRHSVRLAHVGTSASRIAHNMKNIQTAVAGTSFLMEKGLSEGDLDLLRKIWPVMRRSSDRVERLIRNMLTLSAPRDLVREEVDLGVLVLAVGEDCNEAARRAGVILEIAHDPAIPLIVVNKPDLEDALLNLIVNAIDAVVEARRDDGRIRLQTEFRSAEGMVSLVVSDNGVGIPDSMREELFELYFTTKKTNGTGLGLAVVKRVIEEHGGRIELKSVPGEGTTFILLLPLSSVGDLVMAARDEELVSDQTR